MDGDRKSGKVDEDEVVSTFVISLEFTLVGHFSP